MDGPAQYTAVDLSTCADEPIHIIGRIQSFGTLIAFTPDWIVSHVSANCGDLLGKQPVEVIGTPAASHIAQYALHEIRTRLQMLGGIDGVDRHFGLDLTGDGRLFDVAVHVSGRSFVLEAEPSGHARRKDYVGHVRPMIDRLRHSDTMEDLCEIAARQLRGLTGFDRVMVYRFEPDGAGDVIAESRREGIDSFLGLHFPASDIPAQARRLYCRNILRIITDVNDATIPILPPQISAADALDLSMSGLRAVSPIHIEYLKNMGVDASMSVSILRDGKLWGLMACHHYSPLHLNYAVRTAAELFGEFLSFIIEQIDLRQMRERSAIALRLHDEIMASVASGNSIIDAFDSFAETIGKVIPYDAIAGWIGGRLVGRGEHPDAERFAALANFLKSTGGARVWHSTNLGAEFPPAKDFAQCCSGILVLPVSRVPGDYIVLFRKEQASAVNWAGNPHKPIEYGPNGARLTPRKSFELWKEERTGFSDPWTDEEVSIAESLRVTLLEVVLRMSEAAQSEREKANRKQDVLIAELNHRVRNLLNLVKSLVEQSKSGAETIGDFARVVGDRIYALARAHDQVTMKNWSPAPLGTLIMAECKAYVTERADRVILSGTDILLEPSAYSTMALVMHELTTNSCKYGALSAANGVVTVSIERNAAGGATVVWRERGGPEVLPPRQRGFGSSIIQYSVPHELGGETDIRYEPQGLVAVMTLPKKHIAAFCSLEASETAETTRKGGKEEKAVLNGDVLIVEDMMIIAMEAEDILREAGAANCHVASSVAAAMDFLNDKDMSFALLDVNLGIEVSEPIAQRLLERNIPFVVASGYGDNNSGYPALSSAPSITKPYTMGQLHAAITSAFALAERSD